MVDGALYAVMIGVGESYLGALAVELGHRDGALALLVTVPLLVGALAQLASAPLVDLVGSRRRVVVLGAAMQAACHLGLYLIVALQVTQLWPLLLVKSAFWASGSAIGPAWNAWMATLTEGISRERYFAWRSALIYLVLLVTYVGSGLFLEARRELGALLPAYGALLLVGLGARALSAGALSLKSEPPEPPLAGAERSLRGRARLALTTSEWRVAVFLALFMFGVFLSAAFFTPYMLRTLGMDMATYAGLTAGSILSRAIAFPLMRPLAARIGLRGLLAASGFGVALVPLGWALTADLWLLLGIELLSGVVWAGVEFSSFQVLLQSAHPRCRVEFFSLANALSAALQLAGSLVGSAVLAWTHLAYTDVFLISSAVRMGSLLLLVTPAMAIALRRPLVQLFVRINSVRAVAGVDHRPVVSARPLEAPAVDGVDESTNEHQPR